MTHRVFKRRHRSLKEIELHGVYTCTPTWDDAVVHWGGFVDPMTRSVFAAGDGLDVPDFVERWVELEDPWIVGFCWSAHCAKTNRTDASTLSTGHGFPVPPTRTPWAVWWNQIIDDREIYAEWCFNRKGFISLSYWTTYGFSPIHDTFNGPCKCGQTHELPDIQKENPQ